MKNVRRKYPIKVRKLKRSEMSGPNLFNFSLCQSFLFCTTILEPNFHLNMQFKNCSKVSNIIWMGKDRIKLTCVSVRSSSFENSALSAIERYCFSLNFFSSDDNWAGVKGVLAFLSFLWRRRAIATGFLLAECFAFWMGGLTSVSPKIKHKICDVIHD